MQSSTVLVLKLQEMAAMPPGRMCWWPWNEGSALRHCSLSSPAEPGPNKTWAAVHKLRPSCLGLPAQGQRGEQCTGYDLGDI